MTIEEIDRRIENAPDLLGTTGNERLFLSGLLEAFEYFKINDKEKAHYILDKLGFGLDDINRILYYQQSSKKR